MRADDAKTEISDPAVFSEDQIISLHYMIDAICKKDGLKRKTQIGEWRPSHKDRVNAEKYWRGKGRSDLDVTEIVDEFVEYCLANGKTFIDWSRAWGTWYRKSVKFNYACPIWTQPKQQ